MRTQLSGNFYLDEFTRSQTAARLGRQIMPSPDEEANLRRLCRFILQPVREALGPVHITSGLRPSWLNETVGGSKTSQHVFGQAADFVVSGHSPLDVARWIEAEQLPFDQLIHEFGEWVHCSVAVAEKPPRQQKLTAVRGQAGTIYHPGLLEA